MMQVERAANLVESDAGAHGEPKPQTGQIWYRYIDPAEVLFAVSLRMVGPGMLSEIGAAIPVAATS